MGFPREKPAHLQVFMTDYDFEQDGLGENAYLSGFTGSGNPCGGNSHAACFKIKRRLQWAQLHKGNILYNAPRCAEVKINYECTLKEYNSNNQRKLMTKELRKRIINRDNYTCQMCGKYMPDEVGLHVDHIIPISKGGKTVPSNLQVLCSKCNGNKSNK